MKRIKVRAHIRLVPVEWKVMVDPSNPSNEVTIPVRWKQVYVKAYEKLVK